MDGDSRGVRYTHLKQFTAILNNNKPLKTLQVMRKAFTKKGVFPLVLATGLLTLAGCVVEDYDLGDLDLTVGIGGDEISIPVSSTDSIMLSDVLDLDENGDVKVLSNGDYVFQMAGNDVECAHPEVDRIELEQAYELVSDFRFSLSAGTKGNRKGLRISGNIDETTGLEDMISYEGSSDAVESVTSVELLPTEVALKLSFDGIRSAVSSIKRLTLFIPEYFDISADDITPNRQVDIKLGKANGCRSIALSNVSTSSDLTLRLNVRRLDFTDVTAGSKYGSLVIDSKHNITLTGKYNVAMQADWSVDAASLSGDLYIRSTVSATQMVIKQATGTLNPDIDFEIGQAQISGIPDFLSDGNVVADLDNPQILFTVENDMDVAAKIGGSVNGKQSRIVAIKDGREIASVDLPEINIRNGSPAVPVTTAICICRNAAKVSGDYDEIEEIPNLSTLIKTIPDAIRVENINPRADNSRQSTLEFGRVYTVTPSYEVYAPLAFGEEGRIVYKDTLDGWHSDLEDIKPYIDSKDASKNTSVALEADIVSRIPAYLTLTIQPIDKNGKPLGSDIIKVENPETVDASDGKTLTKTSLTARMTLMTEDALERLDGIVMTVDGSASGQDGVVTGVALNSKTQKMKVENIKAKLIGKVISDLN